MSEMKMSDVFDADDFNIMHQAEIVDTSKYAYIEHNEIQIEGEAHINHAVRNHDRMVEDIAELKDALELMILQFESDHNCEYEYKVIKSSKNLLAKLNQEGEG